MRFNSLRVLCLDGNYDFVGLHLDLSDQLQVNALHHAEPEYVHPAQNGQKQHVERQPVIEVSPLLWETVGCDAVDDLGEAIETSVGEERLSKDEGNKGKLVWEGGCIDCLAQVH